MLNIVKGITIADVWLRKQFLLSKFIKWRDVYAGYSVLQERYFKDFCTFQVRINHNGYIRALTVLHGGVDVLVVLFFNGH